MVHRGEKITGIDYQIIVKLCLDDWNNDIKIQQMVLIIIWIIGIQKMVHSMRIAIFFLNFFNCNFPPKNLLHERNLGGILQLLKDKGSKNLEADKLAKIHVLSPRTSFYMCSHTNLK